MANYNEQLQGLTNDFQAATGRVTFTLAEVGLWAMDNGLWAPTPEAMMRVFVADLSRALREEYITDPQGRRVRAKHAMRQEGEQGSLWADIHTASREHMEAAFQQRRRQIVYDCAQLKTDIDSYNDNQNDGPVIQGVFDFTLDLAELELED